MSRILIGIHGMGNKPPRKTLQRWWKSAIREGLERIDKADLAFDFELVYWAHYLHPVPLRPRLKDKDHPLYIEDPYLRATSGEVVEKPAKFRQKLADYVSEQLDKIFLNEDLSINYGSIVDFIIHHFFRDLEKYYHDHCVIASKADCPAKQLIRSELADVLKKHHSKKILLIAHSMGSIIAFDALEKGASDIPIDTLVTIGSPLGLPIIKSRIVAERKTITAKAEILQTPAAIRSHWYNLADMRDKIAINYTLQDDYHKNDRQIGPVDKIVANDYVVGSDKNPHKSYGYLRTLEMAEIINRFLREAD